MNFSHSLAGPHPIRKAGQGTLLLSGQQFLSGSVTAEEGVIGAGTQSFVLSGDLTIKEPAHLQLSTTTAIEVVGTAILKGNFRINRVEGLSHKTPPGRYPLLTGQVDMQNVWNIGPSQAVSLKEKKLAYFENSDDLVLIVEELGSKTDSEVPSKQDH